jgi:hypothetical protein
VTRSPHINGGFSYPDGGFNHLRIGLILSRNHASQVRDV